MGADVEADGDTIDWSWRYEQLDWTMERCWDGVLVDGRIVGREAGFVTPTSASTGRARRSRPASCTVPPFHHFHHAPSCMINSWHYSFAT